jgi:hypothetical protein
VAALDAIAEALAAIVQEGQQRLRGERASRSGHLL